MTGRVAATDAAVQAAQRVQGLMGSVEQRMQAVTDALRMLSNPRIWDGPQAAEFRSTQAPRHQATVVGAMHSMRQLGSHAELVTRSIMDAGSQGGGTSTGVTPLVAFEPGLAPNSGGGIDPGSIPQGDDPGANAAWWNANYRSWWSGLSRHDQLAYFQQHPDLARQVAEMDGIPSDVRDAANREVIVATQNQLNQQLGGLQQAQGPLILQQSQLKDELNGLEQQRSLGYDVHNEEAQVNAQLAAVDNQIAANQQQQNAITDQLSGIQTLENRLADPRYPQPPDPRAAYLLGIDSNNSGHYILAIGNPDQAHNVATIVPGVGNSLHTSYWGVGYSQNVYNATNPDPGKLNTAVIYWDNYNAPAGIPQAAWQSQAAQDGAVPLDKFQQGLTDSSQLASTSPYDPGPHYTVIAHSYGSTVAGLAAQQPGGLRADDLVFIGSPGVETDKAANLQTGNVWAGSDFWDPVPNNLTGLGTLPTTPGFGATVFNADDGAGPGGVTGAAHGDYLKAGTASLQNIADIVTGNYGAVQVTQQPNVPANDPAGPNN